jgi:hypothetical protein
VKLHVNMDKSATLFDPAALAAGDDGAEIIDRWRHIL